MLVYEIESAHGWSKILGGEGATSLLTLGATKVTWLTKLGWADDAVRAGDNAHDVPRLFRSWNEFQAGTKGQFASRTEAAEAWALYKEANDIVIGSVRNSAVRSQFLRSLVDDYRTPSWMKQWLSRGDTPPGYVVDHIKPLSIGGDDVVMNMRLQVDDLHRLWHKYYHPWTRPQP